MGEEQSSRHFLLLVSGSLPHVNDSGDELFLTCVINTRNPAAANAEANGSPVPGQPRSHSKTLSLIKTNFKKYNKKAQEEKKAGSQC